MKHKLTPDQRHRVVREQLVELVRAVTFVTANIDRLMETPPSRDRGSRIARELNALNMANDVAKRFGLGFSFKKIKAENAKSTMQGKGKVLR